MVSPITTSSIKVEVKQYLGKFSKKWFSPKLEPLVFIERTNLKTNPIHDTSPTLTLLHDAKEKELFAQLKW
jgi:hypothetical protein